MTVPPCASLYPLPVAGWTAVGVELLPVAMPLEIASPVTVVPVFTAAPGEEDTVVAA